MATRHGSDEYQRARVHVCPRCSASASPEPAAGAGRLTEEELGGYDYGRCGMVLVLVLLLLVLCGSGARPRALGHARGGGDGSAVGNGTKLAREPLASAGPGEHLLQL
jgi:hypothetical protein